MILSIILISIIKFGFHDKNGLYLSIIPLDIHLINLLSLDTSNFIYYEVLLNYMFLN